MDATTILEVPLGECSAKIRTGPPGDDDEDYALPYWAGLVPLAPVTGTPVPDPRLTPGIGVPDYVERYTRKR